MIPSCPVILEHTAYYLKRSQLYLDLSMSNVTFRSCNMLCCNNVLRKSLDNPWWLGDTPTSFSGMHSFDLQNDFFLIPKVYSTFHNNCWTSFPSAHRSTPHQSFSSRSPHLQVWARSTQPPSRKTEKSQPPSASKSSIEKHHPLSSSWHADDPDGSTATFSCSMVSTCKYKTSFRRMEYPFPSIRTSYFDDFWCEHSHGFWFWPHLGISRDQPTWLWVFSSRCFRSSMSLACRVFAILWIWMGYSVIGYQWYQWYQWYQCSNLL